MSVKLSLSPALAVALYRAASAGVGQPALSPAARQSAAKAIGKLQRRLDIHRVDPDAFDDDMKEASK